MRTKVSTNIRDILDRADKVKPIAEKNGKKIVTYDDQRDLIAADITEKKVDLGIIDYGESGATVKRTPKKYASVSRDNYYANRVRVLDKEIHVVDDYRAIKEQTSGHVYAKRIKAYVIKRNEKGKLYLDKTVTVSDDEFITEFTHILSYEAMAELLPLLKEKEVTREGLTI